MKKRRFFVFPVLAMIAITMSFVSCDKDKATSPREPIQTTENYNEGFKSLQNISVDEAKIAKHANDYWNGSYYQRYTNDCASFASQCLEKGGISQITGEWYFSISNPTGNWNQANTFYNYIVGKYVTTKATFYSSSSTYYNSIKGQLVSGTFVFFDYDGGGTWDHVMIIHRIGASGNPELAGHSYDEHEKRMDWAIYNNPNMSSSGKAKYVKVGY